MKTARFVLKLVALGLTVASIVCLIIAYWDKIADVFCSLAENLENKLESRKDCCCELSREYEDYADCEF